jgi:hypothetical protein
VEGQASGVNFTAKSIAGFTASASGSATAIAVDIGGSQRLVVSAEDTLGPINLIANKGRMNGAAAFAVSRASFFAGGDLGPVAISGDATTTQAADVIFAAGGKIPSFSVTAKVKVDGSLIDSFVFAGQSTTHSIATAADLTKFGLGALTLSGSVAGSQIVAAGSIGRVSIGNALGDSYLIAGVATGADTFFLTSDDTYNQHASIASVSVGGITERSSIAAGINPGADFFFGTSDDARGSTINALAGIHSHIGAIALGGATIVAGTITPFAAPVTLGHNDAFESLSLTSVQIGKLPAFRNFTSPVYIDANGDSQEQVSEIEIRQLS